MVTIIFTLDYEIHGNGEGCSYELMVEPTSRLLRLFDEFGARLTIMADIGEILKFKEYAETHGRDDYHYQKIISQLQQAVRSGHDVQLHIHSSYFNARHAGGRWCQDWSEYDFAGLAPKRMNEMVRIGKELLDSVLRPINPAYRCHVFRAANWSVSPSRNVVRALVENGVQIDTSVFKFGRREGLVSFDYSQAPSEMLPWRADEAGLWRSSATGPVWEVPIYSESRRLGAFLSMNRIYRVFSARFHRVPKELPVSVSRSPGTGARPSRRGGRLSALNQRHAWKADFNQCTGRQLIAALERGAARHERPKENIPFVLIGHSKLFTAWNERSLRPFLGYIAQNKPRFSFGTFDSLNLAPLNNSSRAGRPHSCAC